MKRCSVCGHTEFLKETLEEVFRVDGHLVVVESVPAEICGRCGEATFDRETVERVRALVHAGKRPARRVDVDVFAFG